MTSLKKRSLSGVAWTFTERFSIQGISFIISVILARILRPEEFGLIGMIAIVIAIGNSVRDAGMTQSLIRTKDPSEEDYSTVFYMNIGMSFLMYGIAYVTAPLIADFYDKTILTNIIRVLALKIPIAAISNIQNTRLTKQMDFKKQLIIQLPSIIVGGIAGVLFAYLGYGVWSLVYMNLIQISLASIQLWVFSKWRPQPLFSKAKFNEHFTFGYKLTLSALLNISYNNLYHIIIGKYFSASQLGFYTRAQTTKQLPVTNISNALNKVLYPMFAEIHEDDIRLKSVYKRVMQQVLFWIAPILTGAAILGEPLFRFLFTEKWLPAVPIFQLLCIVGIIFPLNSYNLSVLNVKGRSDLYLRVEVIKKIFTVVGVLLLIPYGLYILIGFEIVATTMSFFINSYFSGRLINYRLREQMKHISPTILNTILMGLICYFLDKLIVDYQLHDVLRILLISISGIVSYFSIAKIFKIEPYTELEKIVMSK